MFSWQPPSMVCTEWCKAVCNPVLVPTLAGRWKLRNCCRTLCSTVCATLEFAIDNSGWIGRKVIAELVFHVTIILPRTWHNDIYEVTGHNLAIFDALALRNPNLCTNRGRVTAWWVFIPAIDQIVCNASSTLSPKDTANVQATAAIDMKETCQIPNHDPFDS